MSLGIDNIHHPYADSYTNGVSSMNLRRHLLELFQDWEYVISNNLARPASTIFIVTLIAIGTATTTLSFQVYDTILTRRLPIRDPQNLVQLYESRTSLPPRPIFPKQVFDQINDTSATIKPVVAQFNKTVSFHARGRAERVFLQGVSDNYYTALDVPLLMGRFPDTNDSHIAILSYDFWRRIFQDNLSVLGTTIRVDGRGFVIIGVTRKGLNGTTVDRGPDIRINLEDLDSDSSAAADTRWVEIVGRIRSKFTVHQAEQELAPLVRRTFATLPNVYLPESKLSIKLIDRGTSFLRSAYGTSISMIMVCSLVFMLIVCSNVSCLLILRSVERDIAVRLALGMTRTRMFRITFLDGLMPFAVGGIVGLGVVLYTLPMVPNLIPGTRTPYIGNYPADIDLTLNPRGIVFFFAVCGIGALIAIVGSLIGASKVSPSRIIRGSRSNPDRRRFQIGMCVVQVALSVVFTSLALSMYFGLVDLSNVDSGLEIDGVANISIDPTINKYTLEQARSLQQRLLQQSVALPDIGAASLSFMPVLRGFGMSIRISTPDSQVTTWSGVNTSLNHVSSNYFKVMGIHLISGRTFRKSDGDRHLVTPVIVNQAFRNAFVERIDPIGWIFATGQQSSIKQYEIIGVVSDSKYRSLKNPVPSVFYTPLFESNSPPMAFVLNLKSTTNARQALQSVQNLLNSIDPTLPFTSATTLSEDVNNSLRIERIAVTLTSGFAVISTVLCAFGLFGLMAQIVSNSCTEISIMRALGATDSNVAWVVSRQLVYLSVGGGVLGSVISVVVTGVVESMMYPAQAPWFAMYGYSFGILILVLISASTLPLIRSLRIQPGPLLRQE